MSDKISIFWFRRDLRIDDNAGLYAALTGVSKVMPIFIFDTCILEKLPEQDARVSFLHREIAALKAQFQSLGSDLEVLHGDPREVWPHLLKKYEVGTVYTNHDYEPYGIERDQFVEDLLVAKGAGFKSYKDQVIFEKDEVLKKDGKPYTVFTPYSRRWRENLNDFYLKSYPTTEYVDQLLPVREPSEMMSLSGLGFKPSDIEVPSRSVDPSIVSTYDETRDIPSLREGTSRLGVHLRFGTVSIRNLTRGALELNDTFLSELIWRDFYQQILWHFPHVVGGAFRPIYDDIEWINDKDQFDLWCQGKTGYPIVDAGMRELNTTGYMHNRVRMIVASFLCKHLLIDWRWGEAYFAEKLLDFDLAANNGGWQWSAGTGCDASPYFRVFNPTSQQQKFDPDFEYIKTWVPEYGTPNYPPPMVEHKMARERAIVTYQGAVKPVSK